MSDGIINVKARSDGRSTIDVEATMSDRAKNVEATSDGTINEKATSDGIIHVSK